MDSLKKKKLISPLYSYFPWQMGSVFFPYAAFFELNIYGGIAVYSPASKKSHMHISIKLHYLASTVHICSFGYC